MTVGLLPFVFWTGQNFLVETADWTLWGCHKILLSWLCTCPLLVETILSVMDTILDLRSLQMNKKRCCAAKTLQNISIHWVDIKVEELIQL
jgi:hypothetical protein